MAFGSLNVEEAAEFDRLMEVGISEPEPEPQQETESPAPNISVEDQEPSDPSLDEDSALEEPLEETEEAMEADTAKPWSKRFDSEDKLWESYRNLEAEFTRRSQYAAELERAAQQLQAQLQEQLFERQSSGDLTDEQYEQYAAEAERYGVTVEQVRYAHAKKLQEQAQMGRHLAFQEIAHTMQAHPLYGDLGAEVQQALQGQPELVQVLEQSVPPAQLPRVMGALLDNMFAAAELRRVKDSIPKQLDAAKARAVKEYRQKQATLAGQDPVSKGVSPKTQDRRNDGLADFWGDDTEQWWR